MREKKEINIQLGEQVRLAREEQNLTQEKLAEEVDVSPQYISDLERGVVGVSLITLKKLCNVLTVSSDQLLFGTVTRDRIQLLANACITLNDEQFTLLLDIINKYIKAVSL